jgi:hypothetical protein
VWYSDDASADIDIIIIVFTLKRNVLAQSHALPKSPSGKLALATKSVTPA